MNGAGQGLGGWARDAFPHLSLGSAPVESHGAFHDVLIGRDMTVRVLLGTRVGRRASRESTIHGLLPARIGNIAVPGLVTPVVSLNGRTGYGVSTVPGCSREGTDWCDVRDPIARLLDELHTLPVSADMPTPRHWCGGSQLAGIVADEFGRYLGDATAEAVQLVERLDELDAPSAVFIHGDFGPHNLLWQADQLSGVIDFDHAAAGDPAIDIAPLIGFYGARAVADITDQPTLNRAMHHRATLSLQVAAAAHLCGLKGLRDHALSNFLQRRSAGTLHDPAGELPTDLP